MKILRTKLFGNPAYKTPNLNFNPNKYKYINIYNEGKKRDDINNVIQYDWEGKDYWLKDYVCVASAGDSYHEDLYYNKRDKKWYTFDGDLANGYDEKELVERVNSPKDWADYMENKYRAESGEELIKTTAKAPKPLVPRKEVVQPAPVQKDPYSENNWERFRNEPKNFWQAYNKGAIEKGQYKGDRFIPAGPISSFKYAINWKRNRGN